MRAWANSPRRGLVLAGPALALALTGASPLPAPAELTVAFSGLRNDHGQLRLCLTRRDKQFLDCRHDPAAVKWSAPARDGEPIAFASLMPGDYALLAIHDENGNGKLDTTLRIPREGFGFSRNPAIRMGPPRYEQVRFTLDPGAARQVVKIKYIL